MDKYVFSGISYFSILSFKLGFVFLISIYPVCSWSSGYYLFEQSTNSTALTTAYVANAHGADAALYNPANLVLEKNDTAILEFDLSSIHGSSVKYKGTVMGLPASANSEKSNLILPNFFYISPTKSKFRFGLSTSSSGFEQQWKSNIQQLTAKSTSITTTELNPVFSYKVNDFISIGGGVRAIYSDGKVVNQGGIPIPIAPGMSQSSEVFRKMSGNGYSFGYNLALTLKPIENLKLAVTYRSKTVTELTGHVNMSSSLDNTTYVGKGRVDFTMPAIMYIGLAYTFDKTTLELVYNRLKWSNYKTLHFKVDDIIVSPILNAAFNTPIMKQWKDSESYRIGITHQFDNKLSLMVGLTYDKSPVPDETISFDLLDTDYLVIGLGAKYQLDKNYTFGLAMLKAEGKKRHISNNAGAIEGNFKRSTTLFNLSLSYSF